MEHSYTISVFLAPTKVHGVRCSVRARKLIERAGFDVLATLDVSADRIEELRENGSGMPGKRYQENGLHQMFVAVDICPREPRTRGDVRVDNGRLEKLSYINELLFQEIEARADCDRDALSGGWIWATACSEEAWALISNWIPEQEAELREECQERAAFIASPYPVLSSFSGNQSNAIVHLIQHPREGQAVCRVYRRGREQFYQNHLNIAAHSSKIRQIPPLIEKGENWIVMPYYRDYETLTNFYERTMLSSMIPLRVSWQIFNAAKGLHDAGYALLDFHSGNVLINNELDIKIVDFDHVHTFERASSFYESPMITGYDLPLAYNGPFGLPPTYERSWKPLVGLDLDVLMEGPRLYQHVIRTVESVRRLPGRARNFARKTLNGERLKIGIR